MGLLPRQARHTPALAKRGKVATLRKFPLGPGPPKAGQRNRKTRFIGSDHPLRQVKPSASPVKQVKQEVKREVKQEELPAAPIAPAPAPAKASGRRFSLDRTATKAAAKIAASKGQSRADAIVVEDTVSPKFTPLTMESLAALEEAEALKARKMAAQGGYYAEMPMFPGRVQPIPAGAVAVAPPPGYYNAPQALPAQQPPRGRPIVQDNPEKRQGYDGQGRRVQPPPPEAKPPNRAEKARRADLAAQARIQLGLDPPHPHMVRTRFEAGSPGRHPPSSFAEEQMRQRGFPAQSPSSYAPSDPRAAGGGQQQQQRVSGGSNSARQPPGAAYYRAHPPHPEHILGWAQDGTPYYAPTMPPGYAHYRDQRAYYPPGQPLHPPPQPGRKVSGDVKPDQATSQQQASHHHHQHPNAAPQRSRVVSPQASMNPRQQ